MVRKYVTGNCCCRLFQDNFQRADSSDVGDEWDEVSGGWEIASNRLKNTASNSLIVVAKGRDVPGSDGLPHTQAIWAPTNSVSSGAVYRVVVDYVDSDNYHFLEITDGTPGSVRLWKRSSGSNTAVSAAVSKAAGSYNFLCFAYDWIAHNFDTLGPTDNPAAGKWMGKPTTWLQGNQCGLMVVSGTVEFEKFTWHKTQQEDTDNLECTACGRCPEAPTWDAGQSIHANNVYDRGDNVHGGDLELTFSGLPTAACDGTYTITAKFNPDGIDTPNPYLSSDAAVCHWENTNVGLGCDCETNSNTGVTNCNVWVGQNAPEGKIKVQLLIGNPLIPLAVDWYAYEWEEDLDDDMHNWNNKNLTLTFASNDGNLHCGAVGTPTCKATAV